MLDLKHSPVLCIGAAHWDVRSQSQEPVRRGTSNPVSVSRYPGGVAHNVAVNVCRLGSKTGLVSRWGNDSAGDAIQSLLTDKGLTVIPLPRSMIYPTATYTAVLEPNGELAFGLADMAIYDDFTEDILAALKSDFKSFPIWFVDTNLPIETLDVLTRWQQGNGFIAADAVSVAKSSKLLSVINRLDLLFCNRDEAAELTGTSLKVESDIVAAGKELILQGARAVIITMGSLGVHLFDGEGHRYFQAKTVDVVDVTGAGDSLIAGTLSGISRGYDLEHSLQLGLATAAFTLKKQGATTEDLRELSVDAIGTV
ncbi:carbohydrate kinase family protein [Kiloniella antarctica]|uniref:Carbohydrate kinase family protein n=1 Tax=Kiloniella antarctica TaxID=1550907 RepID=A0ABW5BHD0_9PROT